jgi:D-alanine-D-alanine ligase
MTSTSLLPKAAKVAGLEFPQLIERIIELSLKARGA